MVAKEKEATQRNPDLTRRLLLEAAFEEIHRCGFQAASLDKILCKANVTKGALYHHFGSKLELGYAVVDDLIRERTLSQFMRPVLEAENPIDGLLSVFCRSAGEEHRFGCPLNNLSQEMSALDEGFRRRLESIFRDWRAGIAEALRIGQEKGQVRTDIDPEESASFFLAALEGSLSLTKNAPDKDLARDCKAGLATYLESLRAASKQR